MKHLHKVLNLQIENVIGQKHAIISKEVSLFLNDSLPHILSSISSVVVSLSVFVNNGI